ncbi:AAA family ATPase [Methanosarcina horonobensis]|uniref:AAA family ATPase n=1 Tax=Methanosarcina horonobensis TaxID=418008 RepID=UPI00373FCF30
MIPKNTTKGNRSPPIALFIDELHNIAPSRGQGLADQDGAGAIIQLNAEQLRSRKIRLIGSTHGWRKLRPGLRVSFQWLVIQRGRIFQAQSSQN